MNDIAYFDNAATTYKKPKEMHDFMYNFYNANSVNVGRGSHALLNESNKLVRETRDLLLELFNANNLYETIFAPTATQAINTVLLGQKWNKGDIIYISPFEHNAVYRTVKHLEKEYGVITEILEYNHETYELDCNKIAIQFVKNAPDFVVVTHVSNVFGKIIDIYSLGNIVKQYKCKYLIDCSQSAGLLETNIIKCKADYMVFAGHKTLYGPFGCSGFICLKESAPLPLVYGGTGIDSANEDMPNDIPIKYEAGSTNIMAISGLNASLNWIKQKGFINIFNKEHENYERLKSILIQYNNINIIGDVQNVTSIISCVFSGYAPENIGNILSENGVFVRTGLHCAPLAHKTLGTFPEGTVRFSVSYFTDQKDFEKLERTLDLIEEG